jgi:hypothetical protein
MSYVETSALDNTNVEQAFQHVLESELSVYLEITVRLM